MSIDLNRADELIDAAQSGQALVVEKPRIVAAPAYLPVADFTRSPEANINRQPEMSYAEAMALQKAKKLARPVLTERGWVTVNPAKAARG